jgi:hypothetical protein
VAGRAQARVLVDELLEAQEAEHHGEDEDGAGGGEDLLRVAEARHAGSRL